MKENTVKLVVMYNDGNYFSIGFKIIYLRMQVINYLFLKYF